MPDAAWLHNAYKKLNGPCLNCEERHKNCHSECEKYIKYKAEAEKVREKENKARELYKETYDYCVNRSVRIKKRMGR